MTIFGTELPVDWVWSCAIDVLGQVLANTSQACIDLVIIEFFHSNLLFTGEANLHPVLLRPATAATCSSRSRGNKCHSKFCRIFQQAIGHLSLHLKPLF